MRGLSLSLILAGMKYAGDACLETQRGGAPTTVCFGENRYFTSNLTEYGYDDQNNNGDVLEVEAEASFAAYILMDWLWK